MGEHSGIRYYSKYGVELTLEQWADLTEQMDYCMIKVDKLGDADVSTVWIGLDMSMLPNVPGHIPLIFETMVFGGRFDQAQYRYGTLEAALAGHNELVEKVRDG